MKKKKKKKKKKKIQIWINFIFLKMLPFPPVEIKYSLCMTNIYYLATFGYFCFFIEHVSS